MRLLLLAPPGAGKGTQGALLAEHFGIRHISSGDLLRENITTGTDLGRQVQAYLAAGDLVPDEVMGALLRKPAVAAAAAGGYVLDGFPRTLQQAQLAFLAGDEEGVALQAVLFLDVPDDVLVGRLLARGRGADDSEETIRHRLAVYHHETEPLVAYYTGRGLLRRVDGNQPVEAVTAECLAALAELVPAPQPQG
ncbi:MAG TPA: adenylate kinase [Mycobacteriales bacterium]|jgi:adenylate kinase|nr:adenylate kinase [Mycobacteriales bacterium]